jgi:probable O-glycosylation ligase (exosortase A-associated)
MRDIGVVLAVLALALLALRHPWTGVLGWTWVSIMNPHRLAWSFAQTFPVAAVVGGATLVGLFLTRDKRRLPVTPTTVVLALFVGWIILAWLFSMFREDSVDMLDRVFKIQLMIFVALALLHTRKQLELLVWVLVLSLGFYGVKGGLFTATTGGNYLVWGPEDSFIGGNNEIALALIVTIPLMRYLQMGVNQWWLKWGIGAAILLSALAAVGTYSRGALLAILAMGFLMWTRSRSKVALGIIVVLAGLALLAFMPEGWHDRMGTIRTYGEDESARGRFIAWETAWNVARARFFGAGFDMYRPEVFAFYSPVPERIHAAHSIYFQVLGEHGFVALGLFLLLWLLVWRDAAWLREHAGKLESTQWAANLAGMCQVALVGYLVGGAFLSLAYFDLPYNVLILMVAARQLVADALRQAEAVAAASGSSPRDAMAPAG